MQNVTSDKCHFKYKKSLDPKKGIQLSSKEMKSIDKRLLFFKKNLRELLNKKYPQPVGISYCVHFLRKKILLKNAGIIPIMMPLGLRYLKRHFLRINSQ